MQSANGVMLPLGLSMLSALSSGHGVASGGASKSSKALQDVIALLVKALSKDGQLDESSPLGKMLAKMMDAHGIHGRGPESIAAALDKLIHQKLGDNFGASADIASGGGTRLLNGGSAGNDGAGKSDLMMQVLAGLGKALLDDLLTKQNDGATFSRDDMPLLKQVAQFMDDNKAQFPTPDSGSWMNELKEDNFLNDDETAMFRSALDLIGQQFGKQQSAASTNQGGLGSLVSDGGSSPVSLGDAGLASGPMGNGNEDSLQSQPTLVGGGLGTPINDSSQGEATQGDLTLKLDLGLLPGGGVKVGLELSLQGHDLQSSAAQTAAQILNTLLQGGNNQAVA